MYQMPILPSYTLVFANEIDLSDNTLSLGTKQFGLVYFINAAYKDREEDEKKVRERIDFVLNSRGPNGGFQTSSFLAGLDLHWLDTNMKMRDRVADLGMNYIGLVTLGVGPSIWGQVGTHKEDILTCSCVAFILLRVKDWADSINSTLRPCTESFFARSKALIEDEIQEFLALRPLSLGMSQLRLGRIDSTGGILLHVCEAFLGIDLCAPQIDPPWKITNVLYIGPSLKMRSNLTQFNLRVLEGLFPKEYPKISSMFKQE